MRVSLSLQHWWASYEAAGRKNKATRLQGGFFSSLYRLTISLSLVSAQSPGKRVSVWIYEGQLRLEYQEVLLAQYQCDYDHWQKYLQGVSQPTLYRTSFASPQLEVFKLDDDQWLKVYQHSYQRRQRRIERVARQLEVQPGPQLTIFCQFDVGA